jgi:hypothetical protein
MTGTGSRYRSGATVRAVWSARVEQFVNVHPDDPGMVKNKRGGQDNGDRGSQHVDGYGRPHGQVEGQQHRQGDKEAEDVPNKNGYHEIAGLTLITNATVRAGLIHFPDLGVNGPVQAVRAFESKYGFQAHPSKPLYVQVAHLTGMSGNEAAARWHFAAHKHIKRAVGNDGIVDGYLQQRAHFGIHGRFP